MARETVQYCQICRCKTWFVDGVCEWADGHERMEEARRRDDERAARRDADDDATKI
jgi:hypothetical protein